MSNSVAQIRRSLSALADQALTLGDDSRIPAADRMRPLNALEPEVKRLKAELDVAEQISEKNAAMFRATGIHPDDLAGERPWTQYGDRTGGPSSGSWVPGRGQVGAAPGIRGDEAELRQLFDAAVAKKSVAVSFKAPINAGNVAPSYVPQQTVPVGYAREPVRILDLIPTIGTTASSVDFYVTSGTTAAAAVAEGAVKPQSTMSLTRVNVTPTKIAHYTEVTEEALADYSPFLALLSGDMMRGVVAAENQELLNGSGVAPHALGLLNASGIQTRAAAGGTETKLDTLDLAINDLRTGTRCLERTASSCIPRRSATPAGRRRPPASTCSETRPTPLPAACGASPSC